MMTKAAVTTNRNNFTRVSPEGMICADNL